MICPWKRSSSVSGARVLRTRPPCGMEPRPDTSVASFAMSGAERSPRSMDRTSSSRCSAPRPTHPVRRTRRRAGSGGTEKGVPKRADARTRLRVAPGARRGCPGPRPGAGSRSAGRASRQPLAGKDDPASGRAMGSAVRIRPGAVAIRPTACVGRGVRGAGRLAVPDPLAGSPGSESVASTGMPGRPVAASSGRRRTVRRPGGSGGPALRPHEGPRRNAGTR
jgi:hypothetical protein